ncbi:MAG TPA: Nif3-like dinuclear metal center hexameric protein [Amoebophilaceae bacterium]|jgi:putative NIF3 family GTP cyclohydrolase 1 type 2|nr:Nif3-like dinuclear metal center hexameric protein [Amoebophilaceae bacterium]
MRTEKAGSTASGVFVADVVNFLEETVSLPLQNPIGGVGFVVGNQSSIVTGILVCFNITEEVLEEAVEKKCNLIVASYPMRFRPLDQLIPTSYEGRCMIKAIQNDLSIYILNGNLDHLGFGPSHRIADLIGLKGPTPIVFYKTACYRLTVFAPSHIEKELVTALHQVGSASSSGAQVVHLNSIASSTYYHNIPHYHSHIASNASLATLEEMVVTCMVPTHLKEKVIQTLLRVHPYEKVHYYLDPLEIKEKNKGSGVMGDLPIPLPAKYFLKYVKTKLNLLHFQHTCALSRPIKTVAIYAGIGHRLLQEVLDAKIDAFITTGVHYQDYLESSGRMLLLDIGYHATQLGLKKIIVAILSKEFNNIVVLRCKTTTNPIHYIND